MGGGFGFKDELGGNLQKRTLASLFRSIGETFGYSPSWVEETENTLAADIEQRGLEASEHASPSSKRGRVVAWLVIAVVLGLVAITFLAQ
jgi:hypothetical protein